MTSRRIRTASAAASLFTAAAVGIPTAAWAAAPTPSDAAATAAPTVTPASSGAAAVVLPTGDRITVGLGTGGGIGVDRGAGASDAFASFQAGGDRYVVPSEATPYAGRSLDLSLFDVTKLAAAGTNPNAHIPVQLTFAAGVTPAAPAGVTFTSVSGQSATGYLTPDSGRAFAQALRDAIKADIAAGHRPGTAPLFGGLTSMAVPGTVAPAAVAPHYPLHILQINTLDGTGAASSVPIILVNTDNAKVFRGFLFSSDGIAKVAIPAGNYAALSFDFSFDAQAGTSRENLVSQDGISVPATGAVPVATIDERTATSQVTFTTDKPSSQAGGLIQVTRKDPAGIGGGIGLINDGGGSVYISPEAKPATGSLDYLLYWVGTSPATAATPYRYDLGVVSDQISANQAYAPADSSLATLHHTFDLDPAYGTNVPAAGSGFVTPDGGGLMAIPTSGTSLTEYVTGGLQWYSMMDTPDVPGSTNPFVFSFLQDDPVLYRAGQTVSRTWAHAPEAPNFGQHPATPGQFGCQACSGSGDLNVTLGMLGDSNRDTNGMDFTASGTAQLYWNGQLVSSDIDQFGYLLQNVPAGPATVRTVFDYDRTGDGVSQSSKTHTDVTIPYSGQTDPHLTLPAAVGCVPDEVAGTPDAPCQILPALTLNYQLNGLDSRNVSHSPLQSLVLNVGHLSYGGVGSRASITSAQVSVSYDNGATWKTVPTHGFDGTYAALWANPAAGSPVELKVTATDCLGGSITQTITNPYTVG